MEGGGEENEAEIEYEVTAMVQGVIMCQLLYFMRICHFSLQRLRLWKLYEVVPGGVCVCVCVCVRARARVLACVRACVRACVQRPKPQT